MRKILLNFLIFIWIFIWMLSNIFAFDANLQIDKSETNINDYINLKVEMNSTEWWQVWIIGIKWLENFNLINQSQSQSSSSTIIVVNWKTQNKTKTTIDLDLILKAKKKWNFILWPATLEVGTWKILTNSLKINVWWNNTFINNTFINNNAITWNNNIKLNQLNSKEKDIKIEKYNNIEKKDLNNNLDLYLLLIVLLITGIVFYILNKKQPKLLEKTISNKNHNSDLVEKEINFEKIEKIEYPEINDDKFLIKIDNILKNKLMLKFKIKNIKTKTYHELLNEIWENDLITNIIDMINKAKYSNNIWNKNKILELIKEI